MSDKCTRAEEHFAATPLGLIWPGPLAMQAVYVAVKLRLADFLNGDAKTVADIAAFTGAHEESLLRLLRALTSIGVFIQDNGRYRNNDYSDRLRLNHPDSIGVRALFLGTPHVWTALGSLEDRVRNAPDRLPSIGLFDYLETSANDLVVFHNAMSVGTASVAPLITAMYDFSRFTSVVDVGGGQGVLLRAILENNPGLTGTLFDLPQVIASTAPLFSTIPEARCSLVSGNFFETIPAGADAYILKAILHDWDDKAVLKILRNCRKAIPEGGTLLIIECILSSCPDAGTALTDLLLLTLCQGHERSERDYRLLIEKAGFLIIRVVSTFIIECKPIATEG